jgi:hypothetical protein
MEKGQKQIKRQIQNWLYLKKKKRTEGNEMEWALAALLMEI